MQLVYVYIRQDLSANSRPLIQDHVLDPGLVTQRIGVAY